MYIALHIVHCAWHSVSVLDIGGSGSFALNLGICLQSMIHIIESTIVSKVAIK